MSALAMNTITAERRIGSHSAMSPVMTTSVVQMWVRRIPDWRTRKIYEEFPTIARDGEIQTRARRHCSERLLAALAIARGDKHPQHFASNRGGNVIGPL